MWQPASCNADIALSTCLYGVDELQRNQHLESCTFRKALIDVTSDSGNATKLLLEPLEP